MIGTPYCCKDCKVREVGCHAKCPTYIEAKVVHDACKAEMRKDALVDVALRRLKSR